MTEITSFPINTLTFEELDPITDAQATDEDGVLFFDESVGVMKRMTRGELFKGKVIPINSIADFSGLPVETYSDRQQFHLNSFAPDGDSGGGPLMWSPDKPKSLHDGIRYFSPTVLIPADFDNPTDVQNYKDGVGEEFPTADGIFELTLYSIESSEFPSIDGAFALWDGVSGTRLKNGVAPSLIGIQALQIPSIAEVSYARFNADETISMRTLAEHKTDLQINNVDNTSDADKPISTATQSALDLKANTDDVNDALALKAPLASPALTGNPTAPTQPAGASDTTLANTAFVQGELTDRIQSVATIADLLALTGANDGQKFNVGGYRVDGIGGGVFTYRASVSRTTHNGGTIIASTATFPDWSNYTQVNNWFNFSHASNGCFVKDVTDNKVDIKEFGALGDDNYLIDGRIWEAALKDHNLFLSDGTYTMTFETVPSNRTVTGSGYNAVLKHPPLDFGVTPGSSKILLIQNRSNITLHNFRVNGNKSAIINGDINNCEGISIDTCENVNADLIWAYDCYSEGIDIDTSTDCVASRIFARGCGGMGVHLSTACVRCFTRNSFALECGIDGQRPAFDTFQTTTDSGVQGCVAVDCFAGFNIHGEGNTLSDCQTYNSVSYGLYTDYSNSCTISNLTIDGALTDGGVYAGYAVLIRGNGGKIGGLQIKNINSPGRGIEINGNHNKINGGSISGAAGNVIVLSRTMTYLPSYNSISNISIDGGASISDTGEYNKIRNIDRNAPTAVAFQLLGRGGKVQNCSTNGAQEGFHVLPITDTANTGTGYTLSGCVHDGNPSVAFRLSSGTTNNAIIGCHAPNSAQEFVNAGTGNKVSGGTGMLGGRKSGTFAGNGGGTSILIPHGFKYAPQWANVYANSADAVDTFYSLTLGAVNITVNFTSARAAGTGNVSMRWEAGTNID